MTIYYASDYSPSLYHHGIKGQKWGVRRWQNADGTFNDAGKKRYFASHRTKAIGAEHYKDVRNIKKTVIKYGDATDKHGKDSKQAEKARNKMREAVNKARHSQGALALSKEDDDRKRILTSIGDREMRKDFKQLTKFRDANNEERQVLQQRYNKDRAKKEVIKYVKTGLLGSAITVGAATGLGIAAGTGAISASALVAGTYGTAAAGTAASFITRGHAIKAAASSYKSHQAKKNLEALLTDPASVRRRYDTKLNVMQKKYGKKTVNEIRRQLYGNDNDSDLGGIAGYNVRSK